MSHDFDANRVKATGTGNDVLTELETKASLCKKVKRWHIIFDQSIEMNEWLRWLHIGLTTVLYAVCGLLNRPL